jgi:transglutaminase-like putative cysteine protease
MTLTSCGARKTAAASAGMLSPERVFDFTYSVRLRNLPKSSHLLRVWIPVATSNPHQSVKLLQMAGTVPLRITRESEYGDRMAYAEVHPLFDTASFALTYHVRRDEYSVGSFRQLMQVNNDPVQIFPSLARFVRPDRLIPIDGEIKQIADKVTAGRQGEIARAHAIYDYVFHNMRYDKSGTGWGHGNAIWACTARHGNCTDFHSLFIGMMRAEHIPARFVIGFPLPPGKSQGVIPSYHCWAEFYVSTKGWVPVDISEAWLNPSKYNFFFGSVDANRFRFSAGRDITLKPRQSGRPANYFVYPYVELNGKPYSGVENHFAFCNATNVETPR